jgi:cytochrome c biogenesis protein
VTTAHRAAAPRPDFDLWSPIWRLLTSVRIAVFYIATLAAFGLVGVLVPQVPEVMRGNDAAVDAWLESQRGTFGPLTDPMHRLGLFQVFGARWFLFALAFLVLFVTTCTINRWSPTWRNVFHPPRRVPETFFDRAHNRTTLAAVDPADMTAALRAMRFRIEVAAGTGAERGATYLFADRYPWTQLATFVSHLALIVLLSGGLVSWMTGFSAEVFTGEGTAAPVFAVSDPGQLQVRIDDAVGRFGERGNPLDYRTHLTVFKNGEQVAQGTSTVNDPFSYGGYRFHQLAFWPHGAELIIRETATGNAVFHETFALQDTVVAPRVIITAQGGDGTALVNDLVAPTDFLDNASGSIVSVPGPDGDRPIWVGVTAAGDDAGGERWQLLAYDVASSDSEARAMIDEGEIGAVGDYNIRFEDVETLPASLGLGVPGSDGPVLAELAKDADGDDALVLVADDRPAIALSDGVPVTVGAYEYEFAGRREFSGISVKRDQGAWFIWIGTAMLVGGLAITFYVPRRRLWMKLTGERTQVAALAEKSGGFENDMRILARRTGVPVPPDLQEDA